MMNIKIRNGFTLIETIVVISITSMVIMGFTIFFMRIWQMNHFAIEMGYATLFASQGVDGAVKNIRRASSGGDGSYAVELADATEFVFYANYDNDEETERIRYFLDENNDTFNVGVTNLKEPATVPPSYDVTNDEVITRVANYVVNNTSEDPVFTYYNLSNEQLIPPSEGDPVNAGNISLVKILLFVNVDQIRQPNNVRIQSYVLMRNLSTFGHTPT